MNRPTRHLGMAALAALFAAYPADAQPVQEAYLKASNTDADDRFGYAVAISGDTADHELPDRPLAGDVGQLHDCHGG